MSGDVRPLGSADLGSGLAHLGSGPEATGGFDLGRALDERGGDLGANVLKTIPVSEVMIDE